MSLPLRLEIGMRMKVTICHSNLNQVGRILNTHNFTMKTKDELEREIRRLQSENDLLKVKLDVAENNQCGIKPSDGEFHHRAFEKLCPMPSGLDELTVKIK